MLITFEGINGCGKTSQIQYIQRYFTENTIKAVSVKEPSSLGGTIRRTLIENTSIDPMTRLLLFQADRSENVTKNIIPALQDGNIVLCDRYIDSSVAYQVFGNGLDPLIIKELNKISSHRILPDITFFIDVPVEECQRRNGLRKDKSTRHKSTYEYLASVREGYLKLLRSNPKRIIQINGHKVFSEVSRDLIGMIRSH